MFVHLYFSTALKDAGSVTKVSGKSNGTLPSASLRFSSKPFDTSRIFPPVGVQGLNSGPAAAAAASTSASSFASSSLKSASRKRSHSDTAASLGLETPHLDDNYDTTVDNDVTTGWYQGSFAFHRFGAHSGNEIHAFHG